MALRAKKPEAVQKRLKLFMFGPAGVGKTTAAIQFPNSYIIDCERGAENYDKLIAGSGSVVLQTSDMDEVVEEVRALLTETHDYRTLVIDPITTAYNDLLDKAEKAVGTDFGRHYGAANKTMKRLANLLTALDMNVVVTAHAKTEYGQNLAKLGYTFDGWKRLDYLFDLVLELTKTGVGALAQRRAVVVKTRFDQFPDGDCFEWSYDELCRRYGADRLERAATTVSLALAEQIQELKDLLAVVRLSEGTVEKWLAKAGVDEFEDMSADAVAKCIDYVKKKLPSSSAA